ncbi:hypothetical protein [Lentzea albida]|uniref:hypothetical protein n=1 Tax=Lentzea albida TaxID=65499 RepID=UPI001160D525|nr:hypothetical protein [Lentzea albida]
MTGVALIACASVLACGLAIFTFACRVSGAPCWSASTARRIAAWQRLSPLVFGLCSVALGTGLLLALN